MLLKNIGKTKQAILGGLGGLWAAAITAGFTLGKPTVPGGRRLPHWVALGTSGLLTVIGWGWQRALRKQPAADYAAHIATGMTFGAMGDVLLPISVPAGMAAFAVGHVAYVRGLWRLQRQQGLCSRPIIYGVWGLWLGAAVAGWYAVVWRSPIAVRWPRAIPLVACAGVSRWRPSQPLARGQRFTTTPSRSSRTSEASSGMCMPSASRLKPSRSIATNTTARADPSESRAVSAHLKVGRPVSRLSWYSPTTMCLERSARRNHRLSDSSTLRVSRLLLAKT
ncbi:MAG TPA: lysoplasmalogenase family protein, partial [Pseudomonadota bacterium]|nr:lysoplasmalogenase family protein [Pseudomonadota bacterium]